MSAEGQGVRVSIIGAELDQASVTNTVKPLLDAQRAEIINRLDSLQIPPAQQLQPMFDTLKSALLDAIPAATPIQPLLDAQRDQILTGIPATPSNASAFAQVRADIAEIKLLLAGISAPPVPTPVPNLPPTVTLTATVLDSAAPGRVQLSAVASDPDGSIIRAEFYANGVLLPNGTVTARTGGAFVYVHTGLVSGSYGYTCKVFDNATPAASMTSSVSTVAITPAIVQPPVPSPDFSLTVSALALTDPGAILLTASPPTVTTRRVEFYQDNELVAVWTPYSQEYQLTTPVLCSRSGLTPGTYQLQSKAYSATGAITMSAIVPVTIAARTGPVLYVPDTSPIGPYDPSAPVYAVPPVAPGLPGQIVMPIEIITI